jgi:serine/threonine protein kinase
VFLDEAQGEAPSRPTRPPEPALEAEPQRSDSAPTEVGAEDEHDGVPEELRSLVSAVDRSRERFEYEAIQLLGRGAAASTFLARRSDGSYAVLKHPHRRDERSAVTVEVERRILEQIDHPNLVGYLGQTSAGTLCLERAFPNPLFLLNAPSVRSKLFKDPGRAYYPLPPGVALDLSADLLRGIAYLHGLGFVHHDVKLDNFLIALEKELGEHAAAADLLALTSEGQARGVLVDLGAARSMGYLQEINSQSLVAEDRLAPPQQTPFYSPPESLLPAAVEGSDERRSRYLPSQDLYAAAFTIYTLVTGCEPYDHLADVETGDHGSLLEAKTAEKRGDLHPLSREAIEDLASHDVQFLGADPNQSRQGFVADLWGFLDSLVGPPEERPTATDASRSFEWMFDFRGAPPRQGVFSMDSGSNRLIDAERAARPAGGGLHIRGSLSKRRNWRGAP